MGKFSIISAISVFGAWLAHALGGFDLTLSTLVIFMIIDFLFGIITAGVFHTSSKTDTGSLSSLKAFQGILKKCSIIILVYMMYRIEMITGTSFLRNTTIIGFIVTESVSIIEKIGLMGVNYPPVVNDALDLLRKKGGQVSNE